MRISKRGLLTHHWEICSSFLELYIQRVSIPNEVDIFFVIRERTDKNGINIHTIEQRTLTTDYNNVPITNIVIERERKAVQQLLISSSSKDEIFPEAMKDIEIEKTSIYVNDNCGSVFETYTNLNDRSLMLEKYI